MPREAEPSTNERQFVLDGLQQGYRLNGRQLDSLAKLDISLGQEEDVFGVADVILGDTRVLTRITASVTAPYPDRKFEGVFTIGVEVSPLASPAIEAGRPSDYDTPLTQHLDTLIRRSSALNTESLCLKAGTHAWHLRATIIVLSASGSLLTCASISLLAALLHFRLPATEIQHGTDLKVYSVRDREPQKLALLHHPVCVEILFFDSLSNAASERENESETTEGILLCPTMQEELSIPASTLLIGGNAQDEILLLEKSGTTDIDARTILNATYLGLACVKSIVGQVGAVVKEDERRRDRGGVLTRELKAENDR